MPDRQEVRRRGSEKFGQDQNPKKHRAKSMGHGVEPEVRGQRSDVGGRRSLEQRAWGWKTSMRSPALEAQKERIRSSGDRAEVECLEARR